MKNNINTVIIGVLADHSKVEELSTNDIVMDCFDSLGWNAARWDLEDYFEFDSKVLEQEWVNLYNKPVAETLAFITAKVDPSMSKNMFYKKLEDYITTSIAGVNCFTPQTSLYAYYYTGNLNRAQLTGFSIEHKNILICIYVNGNKGLLNLYKNKIHVITLPVPFEIVSILPNIVNNPPSHWKSITKKYDWNPVCLS